MSDISEALEFINDYDKSKEELKEFTKMVNSLDKKTLKKLCRVYSYKQVKNFVKGVVDLKIDWPNYINIIIDIQTLRKNEGARILLDQLQAVKSKS